MNQAKVLDRIAEITYTIEGVLRAPLVVIRERAISRAFRLRDPDGWAEWQAGVYDWQARALDPRVREEAY